MISLLLLLLISYFIGAIPNAYIVGKLFKNIDLRRHGSGNLGSTNAFRILGIPLGILVQILDIAKGIAVVLVVTNFFYDNLPFTNLTPFEDITLLKIMAGVTAVVGHTFSVFVSFRGGKGLNTALGILITLAPIDMLISLILFLLVLLSSGYVSLGSIVASFSFPTTMFIRYNIFKVEIFGYNTLIFFSIALGAFIIWNHRTNIKRLLYGNENRFEKLWLIRIFKFKAPLKSKLKN